MFRLVVLYAFIAVASARPDLSHGYRYNKPSADEQYVGDTPLQSSNTFTSPGLGTASRFGEGIQSAPQTSYSPAPSGNAFQGPSTSFQQPQTSYLQPQQQQQQYQQSTSFGQTGFGQQPSQQTFTSPAQQDHHHHHHHVQQDYQQQQQNQQPIITKHFYVHAAPEEPEQPRLPPRYVNVGRPQKNYKIIFVKAPTYSSQTQQVIPIYPQNEEKTIVYVLSKKPTEEEVQVNFPEPPTAKPSKPEVYFINYKNAHDKTTQQQTQPQSQTNYQTGVTGLSADTAAPSGPATGLSGFVTQAENAFTSAAGALPNFSSFPSTAINSAQQAISGLTSSISSDTPAQPEHHHHNEIEYLPPGDHHHH